jgi:hypothetical protein
MPVKDLYVLLISIVLSLGAGLGIGYFWARTNAAETVAVANSDTATCTDVAGAKQAALDICTDRLKQLAIDHKALREDAEKALDLRDSEIADLSDQLETREGNMRKAGKYDSDCISLVNLPVCPAIARELWPSGAAQTGAQPTGHD